MLNGKEEAAAFLHDARNALHHCPIVIHIVESQRGDCDVENIALNIEFLEVHTAILNRRIVGKRPRFRQHLFRTVDAENIARTRLTYLASEFPEPATEVNDVQPRQGD